MRLDDPFGRDRLDHTGRTKAAFSSTNACTACVKTMQVTLQSPRCIMYCSRPLRKQRQWQQEAAHGATAGCQPVLLRQRLSHAQGAHAGVQHMQPKQQMAAQPAVLGERCHRCATQLGEARGCVMHNHELTKCCCELTGASTSALGQARCKSWTLHGLNGWLACRAAGVAAGRKAPAWKALHTHTYKRCMCSW